MTGRIGKHHWLMLAGVLLLGLLGYAWIDGGARAPAPVSETVVLPEVHQ